MIYIQVLLPDLGSLRHARNVRHEQVRHVVLAQKLAHVRVKLRVLEVQERLDLVARLL